MIASLNGEITEIANDSLVLRLGGLGLRVFVPSPLRNRVRLGEIIELHTYLVVREDALSLYGFETGEEREFFVLLLGVNGVGTPDCVIGPICSDAGCYPPGSRQRTE